MPDDSDAERNTAEPCGCEQGYADWDYDTAWYDEHQHIIPGECYDCGQTVYYVYNEAGVKTESGEYVHTF